MSEGLILMDAGGIIRICNESAERILGVTRRAVEEWRPLNPEYAARREDGTPFPQGSYPLVVSLRRGQPQRDVVAGLPQQGGGMLWVSINSTPLFRPGEDAPYAAVATFCDITERRRSEAQIAAQMRQIQEYSHVLENQKAALEAANAQLEALALCDGLTGLGNRRALEARMEQELLRAERYGLPLSLVLLDVDEFKDYNDTFGHPAGDEVLRTSVAGAHGRGARDRLLRALRRRRVRRAAAPHGQRGRGHLRRAPAERASRTRPGPDAPSRRPSGWRPCGPPCRTRPSWSPRPMPPCTPPKRRAATGSSTPRPSPTPA